ncbi:hypothetical protein J6590_050674 [Homalodisca vitripennis]|nr:hypothetical protein J6590_050674 [Homalodisca vitripennis]
MSRQYSVPTSQGAILDKVGIKNDRLSCGAALRGDTPSPVRARLALSVQLSCHLCAAWRGRRSSLVIKSTAIKHRSRENMENKL